MLAISMESGSNDWTDHQLEIVARLDKGPGNITVTPAGRIVVSLHQFFGHDARVVAVEADGTLTEIAAAASLDSVLGLQADTNGVIWLLDNAMREGGTRRLVGWHSAEDRLVADIDLSASSVASSFLNDLAVDPARGFAYIADPASGTDAAIIVVDLSDGSVRRVLQGHASVVAEDVDLVIDDVAVRIRQDDGSMLRPRVGVNPIALDTHGDWLYFGPMHGHSMYRVETRHLRDTGVSAEVLASKVKRWADKPISDGISIDRDGNLYLGDLANNAIGVIDADGNYRQLVIDPRLSWIDAFSFGPGGRLYTLANQLHRTAVLNGGEDATEPPFLVMRLKPLARGTSGR
jgi:sugar lactone lactonase YvrE